MTAAADLRARARAVMVDQGQGVTMSLQNPAGGDPQLDAQTGDLVLGGTAPDAITGFGRVTRFSDALAAAPGVIKQGDRKVVFYPDTVPGTPLLDGVLTVAQASGTPEVLRVIAWTTRELGGEVVHHVIQGRA